MTGDLSVLPDSEAVARAAASIFVEDACREIALSGRFTLAISGGSTPGGFFRLLASDEFRSQVDWGRIHFFWADERCVPPADKDSNYGSAYNIMLSKLPVPPENIHRIKGELEPETAASEYGAELRAFFGGDTAPRFSLIYLGVGDDGHTASLFPGSDALNESGRFAVAVYSEPLKSRRVTLTLPVINNAARVVFLVSGKPKARIVKEVIEGGAGISPYPVCLVKPKTGKAIWLMDRDAALLLKAGEGGVS